MEKKAYIKPVLSGEEFIPQNYIAACGEEKKVYKFTCDATGGFTGTVAIDINHNGKYDLFDDKTVLGYHACGETHEAPTTDQYYNGWYLVSGGSENWIDAVPVKVWRGEGNDNCHVTRNVEMSSWETVKS